MSEVIHAVILDIDLQALRVAVVALGIAYCLHDQSSNVGGLSLVTYICRLQITT